MPKEIVYPRLTDPKLVLHRGTFYLIAHRCALNRFREQQFAKQNIFKITLAKEELIDKKPFKNRQLAGCLPDGVITDFAVGIIQPHRLFRPSGTRFCQLIQNLRHNKGYHNKYYKYRHQLRHILSNPFDQMHICAP